MVLCFTCIDIVRVFVLLLVCVGTLNKFLAYVGDDVSDLALSENALIEFCGSAHGKEERFVSGNLFCVHRTGVIDSLCVSLSCSVIILEPLKLLPQKLQSFH